MERFTGPDASFLYMETPNVHMHTLKIAVIDLPVEVPYAQIFEMVRTAMEQRLHLVPRLRLRRAPPPAAPRSSVPPAGACTWIAKGAWWTPM